MANKVSNGLRLRQFKFCMFEFNRLTGERICHFDDIINNLKRYKTLGDWAYCIHDKDVYTQDAIDNLCASLASSARKQGIKDDLALNEYINQNLNVKIGDKKGRHIHVVCRPKRGVEISEVVKWLGVPENFILTINEGKGRTTGFWDCVRYLTHEDEEQQKLGKFLYPDSEVFTSDSISNWRDVLNTMKIDEDKYGKGRSISERFIIDVLKYGKSISQCYSEMDEIMFLSSLHKLQNSRQQYLINNAPLPNTRINVYVYGVGGAGKDVFCELLSHFLYPDVKNINDVVFGIGGGSSTFDKYDGQPVVTWSDVRASDLISAIGRRAVLTAFDPHPKMQSGNVNVKFGSTRLINKFNIVNGVDNPHKFIKDLASSYSDSSGVYHNAEDNNIEQFYRRFPIIVWLSSNKYRIMLNTAVYSGLPDYRNYDYHEYAGSFKELQRLCGSNKSLLYEISEKMVAPLVRAVNILRVKLDSQIISEETALGLFDSLHYGSCLASDSQIDLSGNDSNNDDDDLIIEV